MGEGGLLAPTTGGVGGLLVLITGGVGGLLPAGSLPAAGAGGVGTAGGGLTLKFRPPEPAQACLFSMRST